MTISFKSPTVGEWTWQVPPSVEEKYKEIGQSLRGELGFSEEQAVRAEAFYLGEIRNLIERYLNLIAAAQFAGGLASALLKELAADGVGIVAGTGPNAIVESESNKPKP